MENIRNGAETVPKRLRSFDCLGLLLGLVVAVGCGKEAAYRQAEEFAAEKAELIRLLDASKAEANSSKAEADAKKAELEEYKANVEKWRTNILVALDEWRKKNTLSLEQEKQQISVWLGSLDRSQQWQIERAAKKLKAGEELRNYETAAIRPYLPHGSPEREKIDQMDRRRAERYTPTMVNPIPPPRAKMKMPWKTFDEAEKEKRDALRPANP